jgi:hypothetical protein
LDIWHFRISSESRNQVRHLRTTQHYGHPKFKIGLVVLVAALWDSKLFIFAMYFGSLILTTHEKVTNREGKFILGRNYILKIKRASVCCCKLMASINFGFSLIALQFSIASTSISVHKTPTVR